jgi:hypothetical protein
MTGSSAARFFLAATFFAAALASSACQTASLQDIAPLPGVRNTGTTPDLNVPQKAETEQFSEADKNAKIAELKAAQSNQGLKGRQGAAPTATSQLKKAAQAQAETLKEIEGE